MMNKTLLVLAASRYQVPVVLHAKNIGCRVVTTDNVPENPGHALADRSYGVDTTNLDKILDIANKENADGIIAACTDVALPTASYVSESLGLPGNSYRSAKICCDKIAFRSFLASISMPAPEVHTFDSNDHPPKSVFPGQWIMKPDRSSGSKGIFIVGSRSEFLTHVEACLSFSPTAKGLLERFVEGAQGTCDGIIQEGKVGWHIITDRQTAASPHVATYGHMTPSSMSKTNQLSLLRKIEAICRNLDIRHTVFDCDFVCSGDRIFILEFTPRLGGNSMTSLIQYATGFDIIDYAVRQACGLPLPSIHPPDIRPTALTLLGVMQKGLLTYDTDQAIELTNEPWLKKLEFDYPCGSPVSPFINGRFRAGEAIVTGSDRIEVKRHLEELKTRLNVGVS